MRENKIEKYLKRRIESLGGEAYKWSSPGRRGVPDRLVVLPGLICAVELKAPGRRLSSIQDRVRRDLERLGLPVYVVDSCDLVDTIFPEKRK